MSQHPSLRSSEKMKQHRSVLKRYERLRILNEKGEWDEKNSVFGLQKVKMVRFKIKKEKAETEEVGAAPGAVVAAPAAASSTAKSAPASPESQRKPVRPGEADKRAGEAKPKK